MRHLPSAHPTRFLVPIVSFCYPCSIAYFSTLVGMASRERKHYSIILYCIMPSKYYYRSGNGLALLQGSPIVTVRVQTLPPLRYLLLNLSKIQQSTSLRALHPRVFNRLSKFGRHSFFVTTKIDQKPQSGPAYLSADRQGRLSSCLHSVLRFVSFLFISRRRKSTMLATAAAQTLRQTLTVSRGKGRRRPRPPFPSVESYQKWMVLDTTRQSTKKKLERQKRLKAFFFLLQIEATPAFFPFARHHHCHRCLSLQKLSFTTVANTRDVCIGAFLLLLAPVPHQFLWSPKLIFQIFTPPKPSRSLILLF